MPTNLVQLNRRDDRVWEVPDSKMPRLFALLRAIGTETLAARGPLRPSATWRPRETGGPV